MPRKINYNLMAQQRGVIHDLKRQSGIVDAVRQGHVTKAEILSGEDLVKRDPVLQVLTTREDKINQIREDKTNDKILNQLQAIADKPSNNGEIITQLRAIADKHIQQIIYLFLKT